MRVLIVDDEALARERLKSMLADLPGWQVAGEAENGLEALLRAADCSPDVVLLDIRMPEMDGLETAHHLAKLNPAPAIIFTTAYQDHALAAFEAKAVDYLLKPVRGERLKEALERASVVSRGRLAELRAGGGEGPARRFLSAVLHGRIRIAPVAEIRCFRADQKYTVAIWPQGELVLDESLKMLEAEFAGQFLRIHRNALVALQHIEQLERDPSGNYHVRLRGLPEPLAVSRRHLSRVRGVLKQLR
jgi:two-component system response regulator AlgR